MKILTNYYTEKELEYIKNNFKTSTIRQIAKELHRPESGVSIKAKQLGLVKQKHSKWTEEEIKFLKENYIQMTSEEISKHVNHSVSAINTMRDRLGLVRNASWTQEEIDYLVNNFETTLFSELSKKFNRTEGAIRAKCFDLNLVKKSPWTDEEIEFVRYNYMDMATKDIAKLLLRTPSAVQLRAERMGFKKYPYYCEYNYFDKIDTEEKAYWLGFMTADGWISKNNETGACVTGIELQYDDISHLKKFNKSIKGNYQITDRWRTCEISKYKTKSHTCIIRIFSSIMYESLLKLGFTNNKSFDCCIPNIDNKLIKHYIRGYFDGDGCFTYTSKSFGVSFLTASYTFNDNLYNLLLSYGFHPSKSQYTSEYNTQIYTISLVRKQEKLDFLNWIYGDATISLDRKYNKYLRVKESVPTQSCLAN